MKLELSIKTDYLPEWGTWHGIRELVQNGRDAEIQFDAPLKITHQGQTLRIENDSVTLPHEALLFGHTTKTDRGDLAGRWGEGLKLGVLALVRGGQPVTIHSGNEVWKPTIARSEKFNADVLVFEIQGGRKPRNRVRVEVGGVTEAKWRELRERFLFLGTLKEDEAVSTTLGRLLLNTRFRGKLYAKGIWVCHDTENFYGYDFSSIELDRDRGMLQSFDQKWQQAMIWKEALARRPDLFDLLWAVATSQEHKDLSRLDSYAAAFVDEDSVSKVTAAFKAQFGENAIPVATTSESLELEHFGLRGVVVPDVQRVIVERRTGIAEEAKRDRAKSPVRVYSAEELTVEERRDLGWATACIDASLLYLPGTELPDVSVVDFVKMDLLARYESKERRISIARHVLADRYTTLAMLVHELAHHLGGTDGSSDHASNQERIWKAVVRRMAEGGGSR